MEKFILIFAMLVSICSESVTAQQRVGRSVTKSRTIYQQQPVRPAAVGSRYVNRPVSRYRNSIPSPTEVENIEVEKFETQTARTGQSIWGIVHDHQKKIPGYTREMFLEDNPEIASRKPYTKLDPCDPSKVLYVTVPLYAGDTYRLRLWEDGPVLGPNGSSWFYGN
jgi:hypothetical protein